MEVENPFAPPVPQRSSSRIMPIPRSPYMPMVRPTPLSAILPPTPVQTPSGLKRSSVVSCSGSSIIVENDPSPTPAEPISRSEQTPTPTTILTNILNTGWAVPQITLPVTPQPSPAPEKQTPKADSPASIMSTQTRSKGTMKSLFGNITKIVEKKRASMLGFQALDEEKRENRKGFGIPGLFKASKSKSKGSGRIQISRNGNKVALETVSSCK